MGILYLFRFSITLYFLFYVRLKSWNIINRILTFDKECRRTVTLYVMLRYVTPQLALHLLLALAGFGVFLDKQCGLEQESTSLLLLDVLLHHGILDFKNK